MCWTLSSIYIQFEHQCPKQSDVSVEHLQVLRGMFGFFEPREMLRSFAARGIYCLKLVGNGFMHPGGGIKRLRLTRTAYVSEGDVHIGFHNRFICVEVNISIYALLTGGRS